MVLCHILFLLWVISLLPAGFAALSLKESTRAWIARIEGSAEKGLVKMASLSDEDALRTLRTYFLILAVASLIAFIVAREVAGPATKQVLAFATVVPFFFAGSMGAWANNREKILKDLLIGVKVKVVPGDKFYRCYFLTCHARGLG